MINHIIFLFLKFHIIQKWVNKLGNANISKKLVQHSLKSNNTLEKNCSIGIMNFLLSMMTKIVQAHLIMVGESLSLFFLIYEIPKPNCILNFYLAQFVILFPLF
jgi:hypothetical protein